MANIIAILFTLLYVVESVLLFFIGNQTKFLKPVMIAGILGIVAIWLVRFVLLKVNFSPITLLIIIGLVISFFMISAIV